MLGFEATTYDVDSNYKKLNVVLYYKEDSSYCVTGEQWRRFAEVSWQTDLNTDYWYGFYIRENAEYRSGFNEFSKFVSKINKADMYRSHGEQFIQWLLDTNVKQLVYDERLSTVMRREFYDNTVKQHGWKVLLGSSANAYQMDVLGYDIRDAEKAALKYYSNQGHTSVLKEWSHISFERKYGVKEPQLLENIDKIL